MIFFLMQTFPFFAQNKLEKQNGIIDLTGLDFNKTEDVSLEGQWEFYWNELIHPQDFILKQTPHYEAFPKLFNDINGNSYGYATYRVILQLPKSHPELALYIPDFYSSYKLFANGKVISQNGMVAKSRTLYQPKFKPTTVRLPADTPQVELVLQIANFHHYRGGAAKPIYLGSENFITNHLASSNGLIYLLAGMAFVCGLFFISLFTFNKTDRASFYFGLFCLSSSLYIMLRGEYLLLNFFPNLPWQLVTRLEHLSFFIGAFLFIRFVKHLFPNNVHPRIVYVISGISLFYTALALLLPIYIYTALTPVFLGVMILNVLYVKYVFLTAILEKRLGAVFAFVSVALLSVSILYIIFYHFDWIRPIPYVYFTGLFGSFITMTLLISYRFADTMTKARIKAETAVEAKSQFLSNMSHEIRTPLNSVIALADLLQNTDSEEDKKEFLVSIKKSGETLLSIINDILDYSKIEANELIIRQNKLNIRDFLRDVYAINKPICNDKSITLKLFIDEEVPHCVVTDATRLQQILNNLIGNAIKFTKAGSIEIKVERIHNEAIPGNLKFSVIDTGSGIQEDKLPLLFERFSQIEDRESKKLTGTGLGLAISKLLSIALGGTIDVSSVWGEGSVFWFTIAAPEACNKEFEAENEMLAAIQLSNHISFSSLKVLLVEDNSMNRLVAIKVLETLGISDIEIAHDGLEAIDKCEKHFYDLIFMDMEMPNMGGVEATKYIRQLVNHGYISKIVAMTANVTEDDKENCLNAGMNDIIFKPISKERIAAVLNKLFSHKQDERIIRQN
ncbi:MAG: response regulator [Bacteroidetes bacterium]|nr:response regulator [Bacteroidota bacterium]